MKKTCQPNFHITQIVREPVIDIWEMFNIDKSAQNTTPLNLPKILWGGHAYGNWFWMKNSTGGSLIHYILIR